MQEAMTDSAITSIPLGELHATALNVRRTGGASIDDLAASIAHHGLIHNLVVTKGQPMGAGGRGGYLVVAGGRRLKALAKLQADGALPASLAGGIPCRVVDREEAHEASLAENIIRESMHPADEFDAFNVMATAGDTVGEIAARFGKSELYVRQRLKLANVAPAILDDYRAGKATLEQMMALAITDDPLQQLHVWKAAKNEWQREPDRIRDAITQKELAADSSLAKYIGIAAYEKAGGQIRRDIFGADGDSFLMDPELARNLALEKLDRTAEKIAKEGWAWASARLSFDYSDESKYGRAPSEWKGNKQTWSADAKAHAGVMVSLGYNGQAEIKRGLVRPEDRKAIAAATGGDVSGGKSKPERKPGELSFAAVQRLQAEATGILQVEIAVLPRTALALLTAELAAHVFYDHGDYGRAQRQWVHIQREHSGRMPGNLRDVIPQSESGQILRDLEVAWREQLPKKKAELRGWLLQQEFTTITKLLAFLAARELDLVDMSPEAKQGVVDLAEAAKVDLSQHWKPSEEWLATHPKATVLAMAKDAGADDIALAMLAKVPKATLPAKAIQFFPEGWLPKPLRAKGLPKIRRAKTLASDEVQVAPDSAKGSTA